MNTVSATVTTVYGKSGPQFSERHIRCTSTRCIPVICVVLIIKVEGMHVGVLHFTQHYEAAGFRCLCECARKLCMCSASPDDGKQLLMSKDIMP